MEKDLNDLLGELLNSPDTMEKLQGVLSSLGSGPAEGPPSPLPPTLPEGGMMQRLMPLLSAMGSGGEDRNVTLLKALRPYLHEGREKRVDQAIEMLKLARLLPLLNKT